MNRHSITDEMRSLYDGHRKVHEAILSIEQQIEEEEAAYLEDTSHGNIIRGWDGFIDSKPPRKDTTLKKIKPYHDGEHLFSKSSFYREVAQDFYIDPYDRESSSVRRKNSNMNLLDIKQGTPQSPHHLSRSNSYGITSNREKDNHLQLNRSKSSVFHSGGLNQSTGKDRDSHRGSLRAKKRKREKLEGNTLPIATSRSQDSDGNTTTDIKFKVEDEHQ